MPVSRRTTDEPHPGLRPYIFHGLDLVVRGNQGVGDCPFCGGAGKFSVEAESGLWRCWSCGGGRPGGGGNALVFIRLCHAAAIAATTSAWYAAVASDRRLASAATPRAWGMARAPVGDAWLVPGYAPDGQLWQLYRRAWLGDKWILLPTPGIHPAGAQHGLHMPTDAWGAKRPRVVVCEGPWDGMAWWEAERDADTNVAAVPGCNVWRDEWSAMLRDKVVILPYDNDHPRMERGRVYTAGWDGVRRVVGRLVGYARECQVLQWGPDGYDPTLPDGYDVRDCLSGAPGPPTLLVDRREALAGLLLKVGPASVTDGQSGPLTNGRVHTSIDVQDCDRWATLITAWDQHHGGALEWRRDMEDALAVILAVCASTRQAGNQLFLDVIGSPGIAKTTLLRGVLTSSHCIHLENATKILSGFRKKAEEGDEDKDCSFLARANGKTWVTCEFDVVATSPQYRELMGKIRRIFDGETSATYGNTDKDRIYTALRTPWIRAGTPKMMDYDQSQLGDRFLRFIISDPRGDERRAIIRSALANERGAMLETSNCAAGSILDPKLRRAYALTGGYVDWLRSHVEDELSRVDVPADAEDHLLDLAEFSADMRARPVDEKKRNEPNDCKELPTRLARQNVRLACCLAVVFNKRVVDGDVLRVVRKVALDTSYGHTLNIAQWMCRAAPRGDGASYQGCGGIMPGQLMDWCKMSKDKFNNYTSFLQHIDVLQWKQQEFGRSAWVLTDRVHDLYQRIMRL